MHRGFLIVFLFFGIKTSAQVSLFPQGARAGGMAGIAVTQSDVWSVFNNQAGLGLAPALAVGVSYEQRFLMEELGVSSLAVSFPLLGGGFGFSLANMGLSYYGENRVGMAYGMRLGKQLAMGIGFNYHLLRFPEHYKNPFALTGEIGVIAKPVENFTLAAHIFNPTFSKLNTDDYNDVPVVFTLGAAYKILSLASVYAEFQEDATAFFQMRFGTEFKIYDLLFIHAGVLSNPFSLHFGAGYESRKLHLDLAFCKHPALGYTPQASLSYVFR